MEQISRLKENQRQVVLTFAHCNWSQKLNFMFCHEQKERARVLEDTYQVPSTEKFCRALLSNELRDCLYFILCVHIFTLLFLSFVGAAPAEKKNEAIFKEKLPFSHLQIF